MMNDELNEEMKKGGKNNVFTTDSSNLYQQ